MTILDYISLDSQDHLLAIQHLFRDGVWPKSFAKGWPKDLEFPPAWQTSLAMRIAERYVDQRVKEGLCRKLNRSM